MEEETIMRGESEAEGHTQMLDKIRHLEAQLATEQRQKSELGGAQAELEERIKETQFRYELYKDRSSRKTDSL